MSAKIIDGKAVSAEVKAAVAAETAQLKEKGIVPGLGLLLSEMILPLGYM